METRDWGKTLEDMRAERERIRLRRIKKAIAIGVCALLALVLCINAIGVVPYNHTGVLRRAGVVQQKGVPEGWFLKIPFVDSLDLISNQVQTLRIASGTSKPTTSDTAETKDRQLVPVFEFEIQHQLAPEKSYDVYTNYGRNYTGVLVESNALAIIKQVFSLYDSEDIVNNKETIPTQIAERLDEITKPYGINILRVNMKTYDFTPEYTAILEERARLSAELTNTELRQQNERITAQTEYDVAVKQAEQKAEQERIRAESDQAVALIHAQADAEAEKIRVDNEAYVIKTRAAADKQARLDAAEATKAELEASKAGLSELVIQQQMIEKWNGQLMPSFGGSTGLNFANLTNVLEQYLLGGEE